MKNQKHKTAGRKTASKNAGRGNTVRKKTVRKNKIVIEKKMIAGAVILLAILLIGGIYGIHSHFAHAENTGLKVDAVQPDIDVQLLDINEYSRPGVQSDPITGIVIHYTANPGTTAQNNRDYFESLKDGHDTSVSSHFVIGMEGEIIQCVPTWEYAYASNERNHDTVSIECCHPDETGKFTEDTYRSLVQLTSWLCIKFDLTEKDVIRHYDVTGKNCPKYFVENEHAWELFRGDVKATIERQRKKG